VSFSGRKDSGLPNSFDQMSILTVGDSSILAANSLVKIGEEPYLLVDKPDRKSVRVYPWLPPRTNSGTIESMQGGAVLFQNSNAAGVNIGRISAQNCGTGYWSRSLYGPTVGALETQYCGTAMAFGFVSPTEGPADRQKATLGNRVDGHHSEMNSFDIVQVNQITTGAIGEPTAIGREGEHWAARSVTLRHRLADGSLSYGGGFQRLSIAKDGVRHIGKAGTIGTRNDGSATISNEQRAEPPAYLADSFAIHLQWEEEYSRAFPGRIDARATVVGTGPNRQPTGTVTVAPTSAQAAAGYRVNGERSIAIPRQSGRLDIVAVKQQGSQNWLVSW
jgi:hypothetical protein